MYLAPDPHRIVDTGMARPSLSSIATSGPGAVSGIATSAPGAVTAYTPAHALPSFDIGPGRWFGPNGVATQGFGNETQVPLSQLAHPDFQARFDRMPGMMQALIMMRARQRGIGPLDVMQNAFNYRQSHMND